MEATEQALKLSKEEQTDLLLAILDDQATLLRADSECAQFRAKLRKALRELARLYDIPVTGKD